MAGGAEGSGIRFEVLLISRSHPLSSAHVGDFDNNKTPMRLITPWEFVFPGSYAAIRMYCSTLMRNLISTS